jgi:hypothetical protein
MNRFAFLVLVALSLVCTSAKVDTLETTTNGLQRILSRTAHSGLSSTSNRRVQFADNQTDNSSSAYLKCYSLLDEVSAAASTMDQEQYLQFLQLLTDGSISVDRFQDLPVVFVMIFYTAACTTGDDCTNGNMPAVAVANTDTPSDTIQLLCKQVLKSTNSTADAAFEYSIRYNPQTIDESALAVCLSTATVNVLLEQLANCPLLTNATTTAARRLQSSKTVQDAVAKSRSWATYNAERKDRKLQSLGSASTPEDSTCAYAIESTVERITELRTYLALARL